MGYNSQNHFSFGFSFNFDRFNNDKMGGAFRDQILDLARVWYRYPLERLPRWRESQASFLTYNRLTADPKEAVSDLYARFGFPMNPVFEEFLTIEQEKARTYKSKHKYSLEQINLTPDKVLADFGDIYEYFGFEQNFDVATST
jgi:hypothetical protein